MCTNIVCACDDLKRFTNISLRTYLPTYINFVSLLKNCSGVRLCSADCNLLITSVAQHTTGRTHNIIMVAFLHHPPVLSPMATYHRHAFVKQIRINREHIILLYTYYYVQRQCKLYRFAGMYYIIYHDVYTYL